jgi:hypothetical protein
MAAMVSHCCLPATLVPPNFKTSHFSATPKTPFQSLRERYLI